MALSLAMRCIALLLVYALTAGCGKTEEPKKASGPRPVLITTVQAQARTIEVLEESIGTLESVIDPTIAAEVAGRVVEVRSRTGDTVKAGEVMAVLDSRDLSLSRDMNQSEIKRLEALIANQQRVVKRNREMRQSGFISQNALDESVTQLEALQAQVASARSQLQLSSRSVTKTRVLAPVDARVETQIVAPGDYVKIGDPLFKIVATRRLRVMMPFPESAAPRLQPGQKVRLSTPTAPDNTIETVIDNLKPMTGTGNRAIEAIARIDNPGSWKPGSSVNAAVVVATREGAIMVPEESVVLRPAGKVVYTINDERAHQNVVTTGVKSEGMIEITSGLKPGATIAVDGAGYLTEGALVKAEPKAGTEAAGKPATPE
jgi:membrane fusion protein, multidrug efflux system